MSHLSSVQASHIYNTAQVLSATGVGTLPPWRAAKARGTAPSTMDLGGLSQAGPPAIAAVGTPAPLARAAAAADKPIAIASASDFGPPAYPPPPPPEMISSTATGAATGAEAEAATVTGAEAEAAWAGVGGTWDTGVTGDVEVGGTEVAAKAYERNVNATLNDRVKPEYSAAECFPHFHIESNDVLMKTCAHPYLTVMLGDPRTVVYQTADTQQREHGVVPEGHNTAPQPCSLDERNPKIPLQQTSLKLHPSGVDGSCTRW